MLINANQLNLFKGIKLSTTSEDLTHSQYADDTILFINKDFRLVSKVKEVMQCFQLLSGLKINFQKSKIYSHSKDQALIEKFVEVLGCKIGSRPLVYLGIQIGTSSRKKVFWSLLYKNFKENSFLGKGTV